MDGRALRELAARQHGLASRSQLEALGVSDKVLARRVRGGDWHRVRRGVIAVGGAPDTWHQRVLAACLAAGTDALGSHRTGLRLWALVERSGRIELLVPAHRNPTVPGAQVHRSIHLPGADRTVVDGIPVTSLARTLVDAAPGQSALVVGGWIDDAVRRHRLNLEELAACTHRLGGRGRPDLSVLRDELTRRGAAWDPGDSHLEARAILVLREAGLPEPVLQHRVRLADGTTAHLDLAFPDQLVGIEVDGWSAHGSRSAFTVDRARRNALTALGWRIYQFTADMTDRQLVRTVEQALTLG